MLAQHNGNEQMNYITLAPEVETPHDDISSKVHWLRQITERMGADKVAKLFPHFIAPDRIQHARAILGDAWVEKHYPVMPIAVSAETPEPAAPVVAEIEAPEVSVTTDQLLPDIAPAFRGDIVRMPQLITRDEHRNVLAERRAIDLTYLHRIGFRPTLLDTSIGDGRSRALMSGDTLDLALVREFATIVSSKTSRWSDEHLAEKVLFIPANLQVQLCQLATDRIKRGRARLHAEEAATRVKLERSLRQSGDAKLIRHVPLWAKLATCDSLVKLAVNRRSPQEVSLLLKAMTGQDMARGNVSVALKAIDKHIA